MNFTLDELKRFQQNGTLESMILSHGLLPMQVLGIVLEECISKQDVSDAIDTLMVG